MKNPFWVTLLCICLVSLAACEQSKYVPAISSPFPNPTDTSSTTRRSLLTHDQKLSLESLELIDNYPIYVMHYYADYGSYDTLPESSFEQKRIPILHAGDQGIGDNWGCSLFTAFGDSKHPLFGRNFDWRYSPALLLYTYPKGGNTSVSMVDLEYLVGDQAAHLLELPLEQRLTLLSAPDWPFDGMNDCGLVIGMAAVPSGGESQPDPKKKDIGSLEIIREILDHTCKVEEAVHLMSGYNIIWEGGPFLHYLIADDSGEAVLIEFQEAEMKVISNKNPWHQATNFTLSSVSDSPVGICSRYDTITGFMSDTSGKLSMEMAMDLLWQVSQDSTQWSIVYDLNKGYIQVVMGKDYNHPNTFQFKMEK